MLAFRSPAPVLAALVFAAACGKPGPGDTNTTGHTGDSDTDVTADTDTNDTTGDTSASTDGPFACAPGHATLNVTGAPQTLQFTATVDSGSGPQPATGVSWVVDGPGSIDNATGLYTSPGDYGGLATVTAVLSDHTAVCAVDVVANVDVNSSGSGSVPGAFENSSPSVSDACAAELLYPLADSAMPGSFAPPLLQWRDPGANMFAVELSSAYTTITVYTSSTTYQPTVAAWYGLTHYDPGEAVHIKLTAGSWTGSAFASGTCTATHATDIQVTDGTIDGTIVYWAPPLTKEITFASGAPASNDVVHLPGTCHGCHSVNLSKPTRLAFGPSMPGKIDIVDLNNPSTVLQTWGTINKDSAAPDPSGQYIVISSMIGGGNTMTLYSQTDGSLIGTITGSRKPTMPNWSPDGTKLVYAGCDSGGSIMGGSNCDLFVQTWDATLHTFSGEVKIASHGPGETLYYPTFSPDSSLVAFNRAQQWSDASGSYSSYANPKAKLALVSASGGTIMNLTSTDGTGDITNSWPRWAPAYGTYAWLAYSSKRDYGSQVSGSPQLWVTAIDMGIAQAASGDPSLPPTWIPGQLTSEGNHTPTWLPNKDHH